jgi:hypothetical protein
LHPADAITEERARAQIQATPARSSVDKCIRDFEPRDDNLAGAFFDGRTGGAIKVTACRLDDCALRSCVFAMSRFRFASRARHRRQTPSDPEHRRARPASVRKLTDDGSGLKAPPAPGLRIETIG